ncbi:MAG: YqiA/YcfP family alpha/beta fold hydrolase [Clostridia bacterium]
MNKKDNDMINILYVHGFASSMHSSTSIRLKREFAEYNIHSIEVNHKCKESISKIEKYITEHNITTVIGTSLGGFYTLHLDANLSVNRIVINPALYPSNDLKPFLGLNKYLCDRDDKQDEFVLTQENLDEFSLIEKTPVNDSYCFYSTNDELLSYQNEYKSLFKDKAYETTCMNHRITNEFINTDLYFFLHNLLDKWWE